MGVVLGVASCSDAYEAKKYFINPVEPSNMTKPHKRPPWMKKIKIKTNINLVNEKSKTLFQISRQQKVIELIKR